MSIFSKAFIASLLLSLLFLHFVESSGVGTQKMDCGSACAARCRLSSRTRLCNRACGTCCKRCNCVPPGTSGNHQFCPCYATMTTHGGRLKCP